MEKTFENQKQNILKNITVEKIIGTQRKEA